jgi:hypothetical protein
MKAALRSRPGVFALALAAGLASSAVRAQDTGASVPEEDLPPLGTGTSVQLNGTLGDYSMMRDASGTAWQPDSSPMDAIHGIVGDWATMIHGYAFGVYDHQGGPRGGDKIFSESMLMGMAQRAFDVGQLTMRGMVSLDPAMGANGYPLLMQTGETANGKTPLIDRQHPHDLFMELSGTYSVAVADGASAYVYAGYPGEPALGPPTFMHRFSAMNDPEAPITHHWLDSTHITYGVLTAGFIYRDWKLEGSLFNGREPDQHRWGFDPLRLNSQSARVTYNPTENWSFQVSYGFIRSPEQLEAGVDQRRVTASAIYNRKFEHGDWQTTLAFGRNDADPGRASNAYLLESALSYDAHTVFIRAENVDKDELFEAPDPLAGRSFNVSKFSLGYVYDIPLAEHVSLGTGVVGSLYALPAAIDRAYGSSPASVSLFMRLKLK